MALRAKGIGATRFAELARLAAQKESISNASNEVPVAQNTIPIQAVPESVVSGHTDESINSQTPAENLCSQLKQQTFAKNEKELSIDSNDSGISSSGNNNDIELPRAPKKSITFNIAERETPAVVAPSLPNGDVTKPHKFSFIQVVETVRPNLKTEGSTVRERLAQRMRRIVEERMTVKQIFQRYVESSTLHGFRFACMDTYKIRRFLWACCMLLGGIYFVIKLKEGIREYISYPYSTLTTHEYDDSLVFPAISFCSINPFRGSVVNDSKLRRLALENRLPVSNNRSDPGYDIPGDELNELLINASFTPFRHEKLNHDCEWLFGITRDPVHGGKIPCDETYYDAFQSKSGQQCFTLHPFKESRPSLAKELRTNLSGRDWGFEVLLNLNSRDTFDSSAITGLRVYLHDPREPAVVAANSFFVTTGYYTYIALTKIEHTNLPPPYATACGSKKLKYHAEYGQEACLLELLTDHVGQQCNCRASYMPDNGKKLCSLRRLTLCAEPATEAFDSYAMRKHCPMACEWASYHRELSYSSYLHAPPVGIDIENTNQISQHLMDMKHIMTSAQFEEYVEENIAIMKFYYTEMAKEIVQQEPSFDFYQFLGGMGGEIGLMLGASLLTFVEFLDLLVFLIYHQLLRIKKTKKQSREDTDEESVALTKAGESSCRRLTSPSIV